MSTIPKISTQDEYRNFVEASAKIDNEQLRKNKIKEAIKSLSVKIPGRQDILPSPKVRSASLITHISYPKDLQEIPTTQPQKTAYNVYFIKGRVSPVNLDESIDPVLNLSNPFIGNPKTDSQGMITFTHSDADSPLVVKEFFDFADYRSEKKIGEIAEGSAHSCHFREFGIHPNSYLSTIIMDNVGSKDLFEVIIEKGGLSESDSLQLLKHSLECLRDFHEKSIIHCDLKPENIIWDENNNQYTVIDLGLSKLKIEDDKQERCYGGTYDYAPPELVLNLKESFDQDIWTLGIVIYSSYSTQKLYQTITDRTFANNEPTFALIWEMEQIFGKIPDSLLDQMENNKKESYKKWLIDNKNLLDSIEIESIDERMSGFPDSLKQILKSMFSYENRPTAQELLGYEIFQKDIGFRIDFPNDQKYLHMDLLVTSEVEREDSSHGSELSVFNLGTKRIKRLCNHIPKSYNDEYKVQLRNEKGEIVFENDKITLSPNGTLTIDEINNDQYISETDEDFSDSDDFFLN